ncbi:uncharacterized protein LOC124411789 isoform X2 [Diprion similis]|uniref:uncharacterized protein LOC124411789 isoform X2 n=1 Tax=Diprion similis TaxID=362088 RepID=UPI001EF9AFAB|nr:uncharacterized protein LOC124411789 isoform X2 [Diprion similis]
MAARLLKDPATINSRVFVGHLQTEDMNKHELEEHFQKYGTVVGSLINRGFGFVQFEDEQSALIAIQNENGSMFKGRRIDVRPAKKDGQTASSGAAAGGGGPGNVGVASVGTSSGGGGSDTQGNFPPLQPGGNNSFGNNQFTSPNDSFASGNQGFNSGQNQNFPNDQFGGGNLSRNNTNEQYPGSNQNSFGINQPRGAGNDQFGGNQTGNQSRGAVNDQFGNMNQNRGPVNQNRAGNGDQFVAENQNRGSGEQFATGHQNRGSGNQNRGAGSDQFGGGNAGNQNLNRGGGNMFGGNNQSNQGENQGQGRRPRGNRGGKNRNKNRDSSGGGIGGGGGGLGVGVTTGGSGGVNFRDRSPLSRGSHNEDKTGRDWDRGKQGDRSLSGAIDYQSSVAAEKNDCEIIVVSKVLTEYAEAIEMRLKKLGLTVDLLFPNEDVPLSRVLGNIASRGCLYAVVVTHINQEHRSLTLNILHGLPQEHRNMPVEDAIALINHDFTNYRAGSSRSVPINVPRATDRHPDAVQVLLNMLADNRQLTVLQYDRVLKYLEMKREEQVQIELGDAKDLASATPVASDPKQAELQSRILNILNSNKPNLIPGAVPSPVPAPTPVTPANWAPTPAPTTAAPNSGVTPSPLLNDPTVQKALDSLLQGNLLKSIGDHQPTATTPLFAAFPNIGRF